MTEVKTLNKKQEIFTEAFMTGDYRYMYFGGAMGGGKSYLVIGIGIQLCIDYPGFRCAVLRKSMMTIEKTSLKTTRQILENQGLDYSVIYKDSKHLFVFSNGSELQFIDADISKDPRLLKIHGLEVSMIIMEEANEMDEQVFTKAMTRIRWKVKSGIELPKIILLTSNPDNNWVKTRFYDPWASGTLPKNYYYLPALPMENEFLDQSYLDMLSDLPEAEYKKNVLGDWNYADAPNQLIAYEAFHKVLITQPDPRLRPPTILGIDVAREGDDLTVGVLGDSKGVICWSDHKFRDFNTSAEYWIENWITPYGIKSENVLVDACGMGSGLVDAFANRGVFVGSFKSSEKAKTALKTEKRMPDGSVKLTTTADSFSDAKAESFWFFREDIYDGVITIPNHERFKIEMFVQKYSVKGGKIVIDDKRTVKKLNNNQSPDFFDATVIFNYARRNDALNGGFCLGYVDQLYKNQLRDELGNYGRQYYKRLTAVQMMQY